MSDSNWPGRLEIWENPELTTLDGLERLYHVDRIIVRSNSALTSLEGLSALETADSILIQRNDALTVIGLRALRSVGSIAISSVSCEGASGHRRPERSLLRRARGVSRHCDATLQPQSGSLPVAIRELLGSK